MGVYARAKVVAIGMQALVCELEQVGMGGHNITELLSKCRGLGTKCDSGFLYRERED